MFRFGLKIAMCSNFYGIRANLFPTLKFVPVFMKFVTRNKWNMLIMNIILAIV